MSSLRLPIFLCLMAFLAHAQEMPQAPKTGIHDDAHALTLESQKQLEREMAEFRLKHDTDAWFVASTFLRDGQTPLSEARALRQAWSGPRPAVLLFYDRSRDQEMVSYSPVMWERLPTAGLFRLRDKIRTQMMDTSKPPEERLHESMHHLMLGLSALYTQEVGLAQVRTRDYFRLLAAFAAALTLGAVFFGLLGMMMRRRHVRAARVILMPQISVPPRLGAVHGGGAAAVWESTT